MREERREGGREGEKEEGAKEGERKERGREGGRGRGISHDTNTSITSCDSTVITRTCRVERSSAKTSR